MKKTGILGEKTNWSENQNRTYWSDENVEPKFNGIENWKKENESLRLANKKLTGQLHTFKEEKNVISENLRKANDRLAISERNFIDKENKLQKSSSLEIEKSHSYCAKINELEKKVSHFDFLKCRLAKTKSRLNLMEDIVNENRWHTRDQRELIDELKEQLEEEKIITEDLRTKLLATENKKKEIFILSSLARYTSKRIVGEKKQTNTNVKITNSNDSYVSKDIDSWSCKFFWITIGVLFSIIFCGLWKRISLFFQRQKGEKKQYF